MVKRISDPNAPKRPMSGYFMWMASGVREKLLSEGKKVTEVVKSCGDRWRKMPEKEKKIWQDKSQREKNVWNKKMKAYKKTSSFKRFQKKKQVAAMMKVKNAKKPKDNNKPKRPATGFFRFVSKFRKDHSEMKLMEVTKAAGAEWKALSKAEKQKYMDAAASEQVKYQKALKKYKKSNAYKQYQEKVLEFKTKKKMKMKKFSKVKKRSK